MERDRFETEMAVEIDSGDDILESGQDALDGGSVLLFEGQRSECSRYRGNGRRSSGGARRPSDGTAIKVAIVTVISATVMVTSNCGWNEAVAGYWEREAVGW